MDNMAVPKTGSLKIGGNVMIDSKDWLTISRVSVSAGLRLCPESLTIHYIVHHTV